ncbi:MAG: hypothetical protein EOO39_26755, partial [Cytophagaceae bacterium]
MTNPLDPEWEKVDILPILLSPFRVSPIPEFTKISGETGIFYPFWIRATVVRSGDLLPDEDTFPYIPRPYLEPQVNQQVNFILAGVDAVDNAFSSPYAGDQVWSSYWRYIQQTFSAITGTSIQAFTAENYSATYQSTVVVNDTLTGAADAIIALYDSIIQDKAIPALLSTLAERSFRPLKPLLSPEEFETASAEHVGQMGYEYALLRCLSVKVHIHS